MSIQKKMTPYQVKCMAKRYTEDKKTIKEIAEEFGFTWGRTRNALVRYGVEFRHIADKHKKDRYFFHNIDSAEKAYWLGYFFANGALHTFNRTMISIRARNEEHLEKFKTAIRTSNKIVQPDANAYQINIKDKQLKEDLISWGCVTKEEKEVEGFPLLYEDYISHFVRGYFDGKSSFDKENNIIHFNGTINILSYIMDIFGIDYPIHEMKIKELYRITIDNKNDVKTILNYIYKDSAEYMQLDSNYIDYKEANL